MGVVLEIEDPMVKGKIIRLFIRARVEINIKEPLSIGCWVPRRNLPKVRVSIKYERLQDLCLKCGIIGHEQKTCLKERAMFARGRNVQRYGLRVGVAPAKPIKMILEEQERRRKYAEGKNSQPSEHQKQDDQKGDEHEEMMKAKDVELNKECFEYEEILVALEGDENLPKGWVEVNARDPSLPYVSDKARPYRPPIMRPPFRTNLRLHLTLPAFRLDTREEEIARNNFLGRRDVFGAGLSVPFDPT